MRAHINDSLHTWHQDNPLTEDIMGSQNAWLRSIYNINPTNIGDNPLAVDNEMRGPLPVTSFRRFLPAEISTFDTLLDSFFSRHRLFEASRNWYYEYLEREYLEREYESYLKTSEVRLNEVRREAEDAYTLDNNIDPIPITAYDDVIVLLKEIFHAGIPMPDFSWAEDGSLSLTWFLKEGLGTMGLYGDNIVIYSVFCEEKRQIEGICELSDIPMLSGFLTTLSNVLSK